jgi:hypothetical protein
MNSFFAIIAASTGMFRSKPCSGWPPSMSLRATGTSSNETILERASKRSGVRRAAARRRLECDRMERRPHRASAKINPSNRRTYYI